MYMGFVSPTYPSPTWGTPGAHDLRIDRHWHRLAAAYRCRSDAKKPHPPWSVHPHDAYWDYTQLRFPRREGMRIDFVLGSPALAGRVSGALIDREERKGKGASESNTYDIFW